MTTINPLPQQTQSGEVYLYKEKENTVSTTIQPFMEYSSNMNRESVDIQKIAYNIVILVNGKEAPLSRPDCFCIDREDIRTSIRLDDLQIEILRENNLFIINPLHEQILPCDIYLDKGYSVSNTNNMNYLSRDNPNFALDDILIDSIDNKIASSSSQYLTSFMKYCIPISTFTIFINNNEDGITDRPQFYPLCVATVDLVDIDNIRYLYVHTLWSSYGYTNGELHLINIIKMIAAKFHCEEVRIENYNNNTGYDYSWLKNQGFVEYTIEEIIAYEIEEELENYSYTYYYRVTNTDDVYMRSQIEGSVSCVE
jgi:hypothetical protein